MAGGQSRRMGQDKLRMALADGRLLPDAAADALRAHCGHLVVIGPDPCSLPVPVGFKPLQDYHDAEVELRSGPMAGLVAALAYAEQVNARWVLALAGDLPRIDADQLRGLVVQAEQGAVRGEPVGGAQNQAVVAVSENGPEPLVAAYPTSFMSAARGYLRGGRRSIRGFLSQQPWTALLSTGSGTIPDCTNLNRPEDWEQLPGAADQDSET